MIPSSVDFAVTCTVTDNYTVNYDKTKYPDIKDLIKTKYNNDPWDAEIAGICTITEGKMCQEPDTDTESITWEVEDD